MSQQTGSARVFILHAVRGMKYEHQLKFNFVTHNKQTHRMKTIHQPGMETIVIKDIFSEKQNYIKNAETSSLGFFFIMSLPKGEFVQTILKLKTGGRGTCNNITFSSWLCFLKVSVLSWR